ILPRYFRLGLNCPVYCSKATAQLLAIMLPDSGRLQEEEAEYRKRSGKSRHSTPLALYTEKDSREALKLLRPVNFESPVEIAPGITAAWTHMGHILGAAAIRLHAGGKVINFSGDIGRYDVPILKDPQPVEFGDLLLIESTYGDRLHPETDPATRLEQVINQTFERKGSVVIPSFAVGRAQLILFYLRELKQAGRIPDIPVIVDSPMATDASAIYSSSPQCYDQELLGFFNRGGKPFSFPGLAYTRSTQESKKLNSIDQPMVVISASGMVSGGRILHHLFHRISSPLNTILFVGYQPPGGRGDWIQSGAKSLRLFGQEVPIRARIETISGLSAHADRDEMLRWCRSSKGIPAKVALVHGEPESVVAWGETLTRELGWSCQPARYLETWEI
ncbi:MAG: MBL fold metallo-hydrolase, partial [Bdellovibrionales bacterium]|nr:MBL fold metallo-hydrolase [Bdellovibrionales bacterium]